MNAEKGKKENRSEVAYTVTMSEFLDVSLHTHTHTHTHAHTHTHTHAHTHAHTHPYVMAHAALPARRPLYGECNA